MPSVSPALTKLVWVKAAGLCAYPGCRRRLVIDSALGEPSASVGEIAHIVARSDRGPRGKLVAEIDRDDEGNLVLLCPTHHAEIDRHPQTWTSERLRGIKAEHETWVRDSLSRDQADVDPGPLRTEPIHSSVLPVARMPRFVYVASCSFGESEVRERIIADSSNAMLPFIVRDRNLITFSQLSDAASPFRQVVGSSASVERHEAHEWWRDQNLSRWYVTLLNRALNKLTGRRGLNLDKLHQRYYFEPERSDDGAARPRSIKYQPLNNPASTKSVVWRPRIRKTGEERRHWTHLAVALRFHKVAELQWVLSIRPERRFTVDGLTELFPKATGRRATRMKAHMYNYALLGELQFWKEYLSAGQPHVILDFGGQSLVADAELLSSSVEWPGVPGDDRPFENVARPIDLFSSAAYDRALSDVIYPDAELDSWEIEDLSAFEMSGTGDRDILEDVEGE